MKKPTPDSPQGQLDAEEVIAAYEAIIAKYSRTEIAAQAALSVAGVYQYTKNEEKIVERLKDVLKIAAGTEYEKTALFELGLYELQLKHNPQAALVWFKKAAGPRPEGKEGNDREEHIRMAASMQVEAVEKILKAASASKPGTTTSASATSTKSASN